MADVVDEAPDAEALSKALGIDVVVIDPRHLDNADEFAALVKETLSTPSGLRALSPPTPPPAPASTNASAVTARQKPRPAA